MDPTLQGQEMKVNERRPAAYGDQKLGYVCLAPANGNTSHIPAENH